MVCGMPQRANLIRPLDDSYRLLASDSPGAISAESNEFIPSLADVLERNESFLSLMTTKYSRRSFAMLDEEANDCYLLAYRLAAAGKSRAVWTAISSSEPADDRGSYLIKEALSSIERAVQSKLLSST